jgi:hypothetical protein
MLTEQWGAGHFSEPLAAATMRCCPIGLMQRALASSLWRPALRSTLFSEGELWLKWEKVEK